MSPADRARPPRPDLQAFLLTNNPARWSWQDHDWDDAKRATDRGQTYRGDWSTGNRSNGIEPGDTAFLLRQGNEPRGIVGRGTFASRPFRGPHWDGSTSDANFAHVDWEELLEPDEGLPLNVLEQRFPAQHWRPQAGGTQIGRELLPELVELWARHLGRPFVSRGTVRQGWQLDSARRKLVEDAAQERLTQFFEDLGWTVSDTRFGHPYDATATKGSRLIYLEAKGTETAGQSVIVTPGEVRHARAHPDQCVMGVLSDVRFHPDATLVDGSGTFNVHMWNPKDDDLTPRAFDFRPGSSRSWEE